MEIAKGDLPIPIGRSRTRSVAGDALRRSLAAAAGAMALLLAWPASAVVNYTMTNVTVSQLGALAWSQTANSWVSLVEGVPPGWATCNGSSGVFFFNYNTAEGRTYFNIFLTAKATGMKVTIDLQNDQAASPTCIVVQARIV